MKKIVLLFTFVFFLINTSFSQVKYTINDIEGAWVTFSGFNNKTQKWEDVDAEGTMGWLFTKAQNNNKFVAVVITSEGNKDYFSYTFHNNTIRMYDINNHNNLLITIRVLSLDKESQFIGEISTTSASEKAKFRFTYIE